MGVIDTLKENECIADFSGANEVYWTPPTNVSIYKYCEEYCIDIQFHNGELVSADFWLGEDEVLITDSEFKTMNKILTEWVEKEAESQLALSKEDY
tara:strand:- start:9567 stop:9854 length:288 start_codon:yes stop_codon:yes gene_type:complete